MKQKFTVRKRKTVYSGRVVHLEKWWIRTPDGRTMFRELIRHGGSAVIVPVLKNGSFVLVSQYRVTVGGFLLEFPAGTMEHGEKPAECARREIVEEIGFRAGKVRKLGVFYPAPGFLTERMHLYLATDLKSAQQNLDHDEWLQIKVLTPKELKRRIDRGLIQDAKTVLGFYFYLKHTKQLQTIRPC